MGEGEAECCVHTNRLAGGIHVVSDVDRSVESVIAKHLMRISVNVTERFANT
jgi:hypothetical protein